MAPRAGTKDKKPPREIPPALVADPPPAVAAAPAPAPEPPKPLTEDEFREALYRRLMANHRAVDAKLADIDSGRKSINKQRTQVRNQLKQAGYSLANVDNVLDDTGKVRDDRGKQQGRVDQLAWMREMEGLPNPRSGEQLDMLARLPETEKDGIEWEQAGYNSGVIDEPCEIPAGCPPIFHQRWANFWHQGQERRKWAMAQEINTERTDTGVKAQAVKLSPEPVDDEACATCGGDGSGLDEDVSTCPDCGAEYEAAPEQDDDPGAAFEDAGALESVH